MLTPIAILGYHRRGWNATREGEIERERRAFPSLDETIASLAELELLPHKDEQTDNWAAFIITTGSNGGMFARTVAVAKALGMDVVPVQASRPLNFATKEDQIAAAFGCQRVNETGSEMLRTSPFEVARGLSHERALRMLALSKYEWGLILEDDVMLHFAVSPTQASHIIRRAAATVIAVKERRIGLYIGHCSPGCASNQSQSRFGGMSSGLLRGPRCNALCTLAYAVTRTHARTFYHDLVCSTDEANNLTCAEKCYRRSCAFDYAMRSFFRFSDDKLKYPSSYPGWTSEMWVVGGGLIGNDTTGARYGSGLLLQNRSGLENQRREGVRVGARFRWPPTDPESGHVSLCRVLPNESAWNDVGDGLRCSLVRRTGHRLTERCNWGNATASSHADESNSRSGSLRASSSATRKTSLRSASSAIDSGGCGLVLVREISRGRCTVTQYGCHPKITRRFFVRGGCAGVFRCASLPNENVPGDTERTCGLDDGGNVTHSCDCRWSLPLVVPLHPPKFAYGCNLFLSMARTDVTHEHRGYWSGQKSRLRFVPVFSSNEDLNVFAFRYGQVAVTHAMVVPVAHNEMAPAAKKLRALRRLFHGPEPPSHAIALDAESAVNFFEGERAWEYVSNWTMQRTVVVSVAVHGEHISRACHSVSLPPLQGYPWFADAPIFSRDDFDTFYARLGRRALNTKYAGKYVFEHAAYMCFKAHVINWTVLTTVVHLEDASARDQELAHELRDYRFTWARQAAPNRLLRFHLDRDLEMPSLLCGAGGELDSSQLFSTYLAAARASSHALRAVGIARERATVSANLPALMPNAAPMPNNAYTVALRTLDKLSLTRQPVAEEMTHQMATQDGGEVRVTLGTSPPRDHDIAIMCVGVLRGLRSPLQRTRIAAFLDSIGPPERADVFAVFEEIESDHSNVPTTDFLTASAHACRRGRCRTKTGMRSPKGLHEDEPCSAEERTRLFVDVFGKGTRRAKMRMETAEELEEARAKSWQQGLNAWALAQFHKIRLAFADVVAHERERGWSYEIVLRMRLDMTFPKLSVGWLGNHLANILTEDNIFLHNDYFFVGSRGAVALFSSVWDHGIRLGLHLKGRSFVPIEWSRASDSPWLTHCSNVFNMMDLPIDLFSAVHSLQRSGSLRIVQASQKQAIAERVKREWQTLENLTVQGAFDPNRTFAVQTAQNYQFANITDPSRYLDPEVFLAHVALHPSRPLGPLKLRCAVTEVLNPKGLSPRVFLRNASLSNTGRAGGCVEVRSSTCTFKPAPERWQWRC